MPLVSVTSSSRIACSPPAPGAAGVEEAAGTEEAASAETASRAGEERVAPPAGHGLAPRRTAASWSSGWSGQRGERPVERRPRLLRPSGGGERFAVEQVVHRLGGGQREQALRLGEREARSAAADQVGHQRLFGFRRPGVGVDRRLQLVRPVRKPLEFGEPGEMFPAAPRLVRVIAPGQQVA